jgi:hypothetical protein
MTNQSSRNRNWYTYDPPHDWWQRCASRFVEECKYHLWIDAGESHPARKTLRNRGFSREILNRASVGINPEGHYGDRSRWGAPCGVDSRMWVPRGFVLPWISEDGILRIYLRRPGSEIDRESNDWKESMMDTYVADIDGPYIPRTSPLFGLQWADTGSPIVLLQQEFDALAIQDEAGDLCSAVATGYQTGGRRKQWRKMLSVAPAVLVAFGTSDEGEEAAETWLDVLPNAHRWPTYIDDRDTRMQPGKRLRNWVEEGIDTAISGG